MIRVFQATLLIGFAIVAAGGGALAQTARGPSTENLLKADNDSANWILPARSYSGNRQVEESEIGPQNVDQMKVAWTFKLPGSDPVETAPIVWDGMVYVTSGQDDVFALDAKTGELKWQYRPNVEQQVGFPRNRGVAVYDGDGLHRHDQRSPRRARCQNWQRDLEQADGGRCEDRLLFDGAGSL